VKETGKTLMVDYSDMKNLKITEIGTARFLHDGGWTAPSATSWWRPTQSNKIARVDTKEGKLAALVDVGKIPHPGRGANFTTRSSARCGPPATWATRPSR
jgi:nitrite reductase (NO-forming)/hydroxylamine reductase